MSNQKRRVRWIVVESVIQYWVSCNNANVQCDDLHQLADELTVSYYDQ